MIDPVSLVVGAVIFATRVVAASLTGVTLLVGPVNPVIVNGGK
jgi:hypothetical protein